MLSTYIEYGTCAECTQTWQKKHWSLHGSYLGSAAFSTVQLSKKHCVQTELQDWTALRILGLLQSPKNQEMEPEMNMKEHEEHEHK